MGNISQFAAVNAKARAMKGKMLKDEDFIQLLRKKSVSEVANYLKNHENYKEILKDIDTSEMHRNELEILLKKNFILNYRKLIYYFTDEYKTFFKYLFIRYESENLKLYIRALARGEDLGHIKKDILFCENYGDIDYNLLANSKTIEEFVNKLKGTIYYEILKPFAKEKGKKQIFYMEMNLDKMYFRRLYEQASKLSKKDEDIVKESLGANVDLLNLEWIYRGLKYYKLSPEELINYTLPYGYKLNYKDIKELCYSKEDKELEQNMIDTRYGFLFDNESTVDLFMERRIQRYLYFRFLDYYKKSKMDIMQTLTYLHLLEYEIRDIISITEAIRYDFDYNEIKKYLIRRVKEGDE